MDTYIQIIYFQQQKLTALHFLAGVGRYARDVQNIIQWQKQEQEKANMQKRRAKLAADAKASGDSDQEEAWLDESLTSDEAVRAESPRQA